MGTPRDKPARTLPALYRKQTLDWNVAGRRIQLEVPFDVFSSFQVDRGTRQLVRAIAAEGPSWSAALDLGCGYGPVAVFLAKAGLADRVDAIDRDALAVAFTARNAEANGLASVSARGAIAYEGVAAGAYDAICANIPAKAGEGVHRLMLLGAQRHLRPDGEVWIVVVEPLGEAIDEILATDGVELRQRIAHKGHVVYRYAFEAAPPLPQQPYLRHRAQFQWKQHLYTLEAWWGLAEFDSRSWRSDLLADVFRRSFGGEAIASAAFVEPGQGHAAVLAAILCPSLRRITLVSRDLIALRATAANLRANGYDGALDEVHTAEPAGEPPDEPPEVVVAALNDKEPVEVNVEKVAHWFELRDGCRAIVAGRTAFCHRVQEGLRDRGLRATSRRKRKGLCALCLARAS